MVSRRKGDASTEPSQHHNEKKAKATTGLIPLLEYVENLQREIHQHQSDEVVASIIADNFSPDLLVDTDAAHLDFNAFKHFNTTFREQFFALRIVDRKPVVFESDKQGRGGVVGFATSWLFEQKKDGGLFDGDTIEIFEVTWMPDRKHPLSGRRLVTKAFAVIGSMHPIFEPRLRGRKEERLAHVKKVTSGQVSKRSSQLDVRHSLRSAYMPL